MNYIQSEKKSRMVIAKLPFFGDVTGLQTHDLTSADQTIPD